MSDEILIAVADGVATVTLNRPEQRNAMNAAMLRLLGEAWTAWTRATTCG
jgi:enoyl-CoA hydratase/carnithine racemase